VVEFRPHLRALAAAVFLAAASCSPSASPSDSPAGHWVGELRVDTCRVPIELDVARVQGVWRGGFTAAPLLIRGLTLQDISVSRGRIAFTIPDADVVFRMHGEVRAGTLRAHITTRQFGTSYAVEITATRSRPAPPPFRADSVRFVGSGVSLAGTWLTPESLGAATPAVVLLHGSTSNTRDVFFDYADRFARAGFAVLVFDKRGRGGSSGDLDAATLEDLTADAVAAVRFARTRAGVDPARVGVWGLSQGAGLAPGVATASGAAFVVAVSPPGMAVSEVAAYQDSLRVRDRSNAADAAAAARLDRALGVWLAGAVSDSAMAADLAAAKRAPWGRWTALPERLPGVVERRNWYWAGRIEDPLPAWRKLRVPALVIYGDRDELVPARPSGERIQRALRGARDPDVTVLWFPRANHALKLALVPGERFELPRAAPGYVDSTLAWMKRHATRPDVSSARPAHGRR
jgi:uncharacterized protein